MQRDWRDPRDGTSWLVTLSPFGAAVLRDGSGRSVPSTISFHQPGHRPRWTRYELERTLPEATDQELMDLLDAARREQGPGRRRTSAWRKRSSTLGIERPSA